MIEASQMEFEVRTCICRFICVAIWQMAQELFGLIVTMPAQHARAISWYDHNWNATKHRAVSR